MIKKSLFIIAIWFTILAGTMLITTALNKNAGEKETRMQTVAICTQDNYCEDYEILCKEKEALRITPTGYAVQFSKDWEDPRTSKDREFC